LGIKKAMVVFNQCKIDEITTTGENKIALVENGMISQFNLSPEKYGFDRCTVEDLKGGDVKENAEITMAVLRGETGPKRDTIILGSAAALVTAEKTDTIKEGIKLASDSIDSGAAIKILNDFI